MAYRRASGCLSFVFVAALLALGAAVLVPQLGAAFRQPLYAARLAAMEPLASTPVPVAGVSPEALTDTWGAARSGGRQHEGIDIFAARGTPVVSATEGIVAEVGTNNLGGNVVWVQGPGREAHYYAHLETQQPGLASGDRIAPGDTLGFVGTSGNAAGTPPHLHYGIYSAGGATNPYPRLVGPESGTPEAE